MNKLVKKIRRKFLLFKYKHNFKSGKLIKISKKDRQLGLTYRIIEDSVRLRIPILVPNKNIKKWLPYEFTKRYDFGDYANRHIRKYIFDNFIVVPTDNLRGTQIKSFLVDNSCEEYDVLEFMEKNPNLNIENGFIKK